LSADLLTYEEVAKLLGGTRPLSVRTVRRLVARKKLKAVRFSHSTVRFRPIDVEKAKEKLSTTTI
jgi:excisionase family DNA binding protein